VRGPKRGTDSSARRPAPGPNKPENKPDAANYYHWQCDTAAQTRDRDYEASVRLATGAHRPTNGEGDCAPRQALRETWKHDAILPARKRSLGHSRCPGGLPCACPSGPLEELDMRAHRDRRTSISPAADETDREPWRHIRPGTWVTGPWEPSTATASVGSAVARLQDPRSMRAFPFMYGTSAFGRSTEPSAC
jgi:hypothetical protein